MRRAQLSAHNLRARGAIPNIERALLFLDGHGAADRGHIAELETAARYGINMVLVVNNNSALNQEIPHFDKSYGGDPDERGRELWGFSTVSFAQVAESLGCLGIRVERPEDMPKAMERALKANRPVVIDVVTEHRAFSPKTWTGAATGAGH
jgi:acetolactate synthase-1/2/3 large subunit